MKKMGVELGKRGMKHPATGAKLKSDGDFLEPFAPWVGKEFSWDLQQPKTIQTRLGTVYI